MFALMRAGLVAAVAAACLGIAAFSATAADKPFQNSDLADQRRSARGADQGRCRNAGKAGRADPARCRCGLCQKRFPRRHGAARADRCGGAERHARPGCGSLAPFSKSARPTTASARCCSIAPPTRPTSPISAPPIAAKKPTAWRSSARCSPNVSYGGRRSMRCGCRSNCARSPTCAGNTSGCATNTASACSITRSMPTPPRRAPAFSSPRTCRRAPTSRRLSCSPAPTSRHCRSLRNSFASKA